MSVQVQKHLRSLNSVLPLPNYLVLHVESFLLWSEDKPFSEMGLLENMRTLDSWRFVNKRTYADVEKIMYKSFLCFYGSIELNKRVYGSYWFQYWNVCNRCVRPLPLTNKLITMVMGSQRRLCQTCLERAKLRQCNRCKRHTKFYRFSRQREGQVCGNKDGCNQFYCRVCIVSSYKTTTRSTSCSLLYFCDSYQQLCASCEQPTLCNCPDCRPARNWVSFCANGWCTSRLCDSCCTTGEYCQSCQYEITNE